jgi:hypothetical protein
VKRPRYPRRNGAASLKLRKLGADLSELGSYPRRIAAPLLEYEKHEGVCFTTEYYRGELPPRH